MLIVLFTALGVGGATLIGALIGFIFKNISPKITDMLLGFAGGIMLSAAIVGLILPSLETGEGHAIIITILGIIIGAILLNIIDKVVPHLHKPIGEEIENHPKSKKALNKTMLFVLAIAIHNFPEGMAAGVGFSAGDNIGAITIAVGIALQNIPEGMIIIAPLLAMGMSKKKTLLIASLTGLVEVVGTFVGYFAIHISANVLPFLLAFAGGTMLYVISDEMIPEMRRNGNETLATYSLIIGFCVMLAIDFLI